MHHLLPPSVDRSVASIRRAGAALAVAAVVWSVAPAPMAAAAAGTVSGTVFIDQSHHPIAGVTVQLVDAGGAVVTSTTTDANGAYVLGAVAGSYTVRELQPSGYLPGAVEPDNEIGVSLTDDTSFPGLDFSETVTRKEVCAAVGQPAPVYGLVYGAPILEWDATTRARIPSGIPAVPASLNTSGQFNALMIDPVHRRMVVEINPAAVGKGAFLAAYDERKGGWYRASNEIVWDNNGVPTKLTGNVPRGGFAPDGTGYLAYAFVGGGITWKITSTSEFDYQVDQIQDLSENPISGATSGDLAFDADGQGWFLAGAASAAPSGVTLQLSKFTPSETPGVRSAVDPYLRLTYNGADVPSAWNLTGFAFGGDGYGYITTNNNSPRGMYRFALDTGVLVRIDPTDTTYAGLNWYDAGSCALPSVSTTLAVTKEIVGESGTITGVAEPGETLTYRIRVRNDGVIAQTIPGSSVTETVPDHTTAVGPGDSFAFAAGAPAGTTAAASAQVLLAPGAHQDYSFRVKVDAILPIGPVAITNIVTVPRADCSTQDCIATIGGGGTVTGSVYEDGTGAPLANVTITLLDAGGASVATTVTDAGGHYRFTDLTAGSYTVVETQPTGYEPGAVVPGNTIAVSVPLGGTSSGNDFSELRLVSIGDRVWNDLDADGVQDAGEPGLGGVTVDLLDGGGAVVASTITDGAGAYRFTALRPGTYRVRFTAPGGLVASPAESSPSPSGSDARTGGRTDPVALVSGASRDDVDAGFFEAVSVTGTAWTDDDGDGTVGPAEPPIAGATVTLTGTDLFGTPVTATVTTGPDGSYSFGHVLPGTYTLAVDGVASPVPVAVVAGRSEVLDFRVTPSAVTTTAPGPTGSTTPPSTALPSTAPPVPDAGARQAHGLAFTGGGLGLGVAGSVMVLWGALALRLRRRDRRA